MKSLSLCFALWLVLGCAPSVAPSAPVTGASSVPVAQPASSAAVVPSADGGPLVLKGTPEIPSALVQRMNQYNEARSAALSDIAPDGKSMLVSTRFGQTSQLHLVAQALGARTQLTFREEPIQAASFSPVDAGRVLFMADRGGNEQYQIYHLQRQTGEIELLTDGKSRHLDYVWSPDGGQIAYASNARNGKDMDIYVADSRKPGAAERVLEREGHWFPIEFSRDRGLLLLGHYVSINDSRLHLFDLKLRKLTRLSPEAPGAYLPATLSPSGNKVYVATDRAGEFKQLQVLDVNSLAFTALSADIPWNVEELALSADGNTLAFVTNQEGYGVLHTLDTRTQKHKPVAGIPKGIVSGLRFADRAGLLGFSLTSAGRTGDAYRYDMASGKLERWTESEVGGLNPERFVEPSLVRYKSFDGREIPAFYYKPRGNGPFPVVISIHGGPEAQARPSFNSLLQYLVVEAGMAVLVPNVRGSDGYGKSYLLLDNGFKREDSVKDIGALLDWLGKQPELDPKRVGVFGGSYGGYMVLASLVHFGSRIRAGVDVVGISNFVTFLENTQEYRRDLRRAEYGDERKAEMRKFLQRISPASQAGKIQSALFVAHGANDPRVPLSETDQIVAAVEAAGQDVWYMVAMNEGHGFRKKVNRDTFSLLTVLFFSSHLK